MKQIKTTEAVGHVLCHDLTQIIKGVKKGVAFKKGHIVKEEDIEIMLSMGKENLYVFEFEEGKLHENDAAVILGEICKNENMIESSISEGKIELSAECNGLFQVDVEKLLEINSLEEIIIATRHTNYPVKKGDVLIGTRVIPLVIDEKKMMQAKDIMAGTPISKLTPYKPKKVGIVTTGSEVYFKRIVDTFTPVIVEKVEEFGCSIIGHKTVNDDKEMIVDAIKKLKNNGAEMIICTGGMSVDPDDVTPTAIKECGANLVSYGAPVLPGSMFLLAYFDDNTPVLGLPGCVMYTKTTIFDLVLPRIMADIEITKKDLASMGHGGLCFKCKECVYPHCEFGKGV